MSWNVVFREWLGLVFSKFSYLNHFGKLKSTCKDIYLLIIIPTS